MNWRPTKDSNLCEGTHNCDGCAGIMIEDEPTMPTFVVIHPGHDQWQVWGPGGDERPDGWVYGRDVLYGTFRRANDAHLFAAAKDLETT